MKTTMETLVTEGIKISVEPFYLSEESIPIQQRYLHGYRVTIENQSGQTVQLLRRHWVIVESNGVQREVKGDGVIGEQPVLSPGEHHKYASWCPMMTDIGKMYGFFYMENVTDGRQFKVMIPEFRLIPPFKLN